jgi:hypothetical protein
LPAERDRPVPDRYEAFGKYVTDAYGFEWQRKQSIETRSLALITANIALLTVITLLAERLNLLDQLHTGCVQNFAAASLILYGVSTVIALLTALPFNYPSVHAADLTDMLGEVMTLNDEAVDAEVIELRIEELRQAQNTNRTRSFLLVAGFLTTVVASVLLGIGFYLAVNNA